MECTSKCQSKCHMYELTAVIQTGNLEEAKAYIKSCGSPFHGYDTSGRTLLHVAASYGTIANLNPNFLCLQAHSFYFISTGFFPVLNICYQICISHFIHYPFTGLNFVKVQFLSPTSELFSCTSQRIID